MESDVLVFGDEAVDTSIVTELNNLGVSAIHYKDTALGNIQRPIKDPEVAVYARILDAVILTRDFAPPSFEIVTTADVNGKEVQERFTNNKVLVRNRLYSDRSIALDEITKGSKYKMKSGSNGHNGIYKYVPQNIQRKNNGVNKLATAVKHRLEQKSNLHNCVETIRI